MTAATDQQILSAFSQGQSAAAKGGYLSGKMAATPSTAASAGQCHHKPSRNHQLNHAPGRETR